MIITKLLKTNQSLDENQYLLARCFKTLLIYNCELPSIQTVYQYFNH